MKIFLKIQKYNMGVYGSVFLVKYLFCCCFLPTFLIPTIVIPVFASIHLPISHSFKNKCERKKIFFFKQLYAFFNLVLLKQWHLHFNKTWSQISLAILNYDLKLPHRLKGKEKIEHLLNFTAFIQRFERLIYDYFFVGNRNKKLNL